MHQHEPTSASGRKVFIAPHMELVLAAVLFSTGGAAIKATVFTSWQVAGLRSVFAAAMVLLLLPASRRNWTWGKAIVGLAYAATMILFVAANKLTTAMNTIFLQDTAPFYIVVLSPLLLKERVRLNDIVAMVVVMAGLAMFFIGSELPQGTAPNPVLGNILAVTSGLTWAGTIMGLRWLGKRDPRSGTALPAVVLGNLVTIAICVPAGLPVHAQSIADWLIIAYLGVFQVGLAYVLMSRGLAHTPAAVASILLLVEPVFNPIWAFLFHHEVPGPWAVAGAGLILIATVARALASDRSDPVGGEV